MFGWMCDATTVSYIFRLMAYVMLIVTLTAVLYSPTNIITVIRSYVINDSQRNPKSITVQERGPKDLNP